MELKIINQNQMGQNIYVYYDNISKDAVIIDPGNNHDEILKEIQGFNIKYILLTHSHFDHITFVTAIKEATNASLCAHMDELPLLLDPELNYSTKGPNGPISLVADTTLQDNDTFTIGSAIIKVIHTPGHTAGGICFYDEKNKILFTGDTLFRHDIGRADLPTGNESILVNSIKTKLLTLPDDVIVYPGHGPSSTIKDEKEGNRYVR